MLNNMSPNKNFHSKEEKEAIGEEITYDTVPDEEAATNGDSNRMEKELFRAKMIKLFVLIIIIFVALLVIGYIISLFTKKNYTYSSVEEVMKDAAISYFEENKSRLPKTTEETVEISTSVLVNNKYMKDFSYYLKNESCNGKVSVLKVGSNEYNYIPYLTCGNNYTTTAFYKKIIDEKNVVTEGFGLYQLNGEYVYRGSDVKNYAKFSDSNILWRIVKVDSNNDVVLIDDGRSINSFSWDERYNNTHDGNVGINIYNNSNISSILNNIYNNKITAEESNYLYDDEKTYLTKEDKKKLVKFSACVGKRSLNDTSKNGTAECSEQYTTKISLLPVYDFLNASLDANCTSADKPDCQNYNYLGNGTNYWLANGNLEDNSKVYRVSGLNYIQKQTASSVSYLRVVIHVSADAMFEKGKGTKSNPYVIR